MVRFRATKPEPKDPSLQRGGMIRGFTPLMIAVLVGVVSFAQCLTDALRTAIEKLL
jgi:hypothetical protein